MRIGEWDIQIVSGGPFRLDGGAMFGTVPKVVWNPLLPADEQNRIPMATNCLLLRRPGQVVLVDAGNGDKEDAVFRDRFQLEDPGALETNLGRLGVAPGDVDLLVLSHLHFDHAGGATRLDADGEAVPRFPNARAVVQKLELADARQPNLRVRASYLPWNWEPLAAAGRLETLDGSAELLPGLSVRLAPGHMPGLQIVVIEGEGRKLIYPADLIPTSRHIQPAWVMGYDLDVVACIHERLKLLEEITGTEAVLVFEH